MARRLVRIGVASTALIPSVAMALGLGALESESALNQPLQARIPLESASAQEIETLEVQLASQEAFERVGLDRPFSLSNLEFDVVTEGADAPYIEVTTSDSVREPFLAFLIELDWSGGRLLREYTLLLDPPVRDGQQPDTTVAEGRERGGEAPEPDGGDATQGRTTGRSASAGAGQRPDEIRVQQDDTLWELADEARQGDVSVHQMMMAMLEANPDAFRNDNVNNLQAGSVLRVPDEEQARALTASEARQRFASQMEAWRSGRTPDPEQPDEEAVAEEDGDGQGQDDGRLEIAAAGESGGEDATASLMDEDLEPNRENIERLQSELQGLRESEAQLESENEELQRKTDELLDRVRALENTIDIQVERGVPGVTGTGEDQQPQASGDTAAEPGDESASASGDADAGDDGDTKSADESAGDDSGIVVSQDDDDADTGTEEQAGAVDDAEGAGDDGDGTGTDGTGTDGDAASGSDDQQVAASEAGDSTQATPFWQDYRVMGLGAAGLAALALLGLLLARRRRGEAVDASDSIDETETTVPPVASAQSQTATVDTAAEDQGADAVAAAMAPEEPAASSAASSAGSDQDVDPLEEIEIYLAYGRYDQAGDLLASAIASEPERKDLRLKQLEIHGLTHDRAAFESDAQALYGLVDGPNDPVWQQAREMGREVAPENPLFSDGDASTQPASTQAEAASTGSDDDFSDLDFSLDDTGPAATQPESPAEREPAAPAEPAASETESFDLDFDLDDTGAAAGGETAAEPAASGADAEETSRTDTAASDSLDMEFDLGDLGAPSRGESSEASEPAAETGGDAAAGEDDTPSFSLDELDLGDAESDAQAEEQGLQYEGPEAFASESEPDTGSTDTATAEPAGETETGPADAGTEADDGGGDDDDLFDAGDENSTKIDLARAYLDMGDGEGARSLLDEVIAEGSDEQKAEARSLYEEAR